MPWDLAESQRISGKCWPKVAGFFAYQASKIRWVHGMDFGYSQSNATLDLCVNVLVRPTHISPRHSQGPQGRVYPSGVHGKARIVVRLSVTYCSPAALTGPSP